MQRQEPFQMSPGTRAPVHNLRNPDNRRLKSVFDSPGCFSRPLRRPTWLARHSTYSYPVATSNQDSKVSKVSNPDNRKFKKTKTNLSERRPIATRRSIVNFGRRPELRIVLTRRRKRRVTVRRRRAETGEMNLRIQTHGRLLNAFTPLHFFSPLYFNIPAALLPVLASPSALAFNDPLYQEILD